MGFKPKMTKKRWKASNEREIIQFWEDNETYKYIQNPQLSNYILDTPPPYVSGRAHLGFAVHYAQIDMIARYKRMKGFNVIFPACADRNGLPVEVKVEQKLGKSMHEMDREDFLRICKKELDKAEENTLQVMKWMGLSCNTFYGSPEIFYQTDSSKYRYNTQKTFIKAWYDGLIIRDTRPNNWCIECGTTIADAEIEYRNDDSYLHYIQFQVNNSSKKITIATTRPELITTCELIIFHPSDKRYANLEGKTAVTPIFGKTVPIHAHREAIPEFGTGIMMICAYGDKSDVKILREFAITNPKTVIDSKGHFNENGDKYTGLSINEAQKTILDDLKNINVVEKSEPTSRRVPICWRSKTPIEIIAMDEYYLKQVEIIPELQELAKQMEFFPSNSKIILDNWINSISMDWAISRRRFYGTSIPIWYCPKCGEANVPLEDQLDQYYEAWKEECPLKECLKCKASMKKARGESRTFDTWFDSSISELAACNYENLFFESKNNQFFKDNFPCSIRPQGKEIVRTWLYYTILRSYHLFKQPPFKEVWISGLIMDPYGGKMSKSLGNSIDPLLFLQPEILPKNTPESLRPDKNSWKIIAELEKSTKFLGEKSPNLYYGADSVRLTSCMQGSHGSDIRFSLAKLDGNSRFLTKLWNIARFISSFPMEEIPKDLIPTDQWILKSFDALIQRCNEGFELLDFSIPAENIYNWIWNIFAPHYIELVKSRAYSKDPTRQDEARSAQYTLHHILQITLKLLAPISPFITEGIFQEIYNPKDSIHLERIPESTHKQIKEDPRTDEILKIDSFIWKAKKERKFSLKDPIKELFLNDVLEEFIPDLREMHNIKKITIGKPSNPSDYIQNEDYYLKFPT